jgi:hypothetical protein
LIRAHFAKRGKKPSGIDAFRAKSGDFHFFDGTIVLTDLRRERRAGAVAAPAPSPRRRRRPARSAHAEKPEGIQRLRASSRKFFPKIRICAILLFEGRAPIGARHPGERRCAGPRKSSSTIAHSPSRGSRRGSATCAFRSPRSAAFSAVAQERRADARGDPHHAACAIQRSPPVRHPRLRLARLADTRAGCATRRPQTRCSPARSRARRSCAWALP